MIRFCCAVFLLMIGGSLGAQNKMIDSLTARLKEPLNDTLRADIQMNLAIEYEGVDTALAAKNYREALAFAKSKKLLFEQGVIYYNSSFLSAFNGRYIKCQKLLDSALFCLQQSPHPRASFRTAQVYSSLGNNYWRLNEWKKSVDNRMKAIAIFDKLKRHSNLVVMYINLSTAYKEMTDFDKQEEYALRALKEAKQTGKKEDLFSAHSSIMYALSNKKEYTAADQYLDSARLYYGPHADHRSILSYHLIAGLVNMNLFIRDATPEKLKEATTHFNDCYELAVRYNDAFTIVQARIQQARILSLQKKYVQAEKELLALLAELKAAHDISQWIVVQDYLTRLYADSGSYRKAYESYREYTIINDSIANQQNKKYTADLEKKYEAEKRERQIALLETDKQQRDVVIIISVGGSVALLIILLLLYRTYRQRQRLQQQRITELETEKQLAATEAVLQGEENERTRLAKDLHDGLGGMLSGIKHSLNTMKDNLIMTPENQRAFERSIDMLDSSIKEMRRVAHNMMPEALIRFGVDTALRDFCNDINKSGALKVTYQSIGLEDSMISQSGAVALYRIVQELLHNTMKHASAASALVQVARSNHVLSLTVEDDGKGFEVGSLQHAEGIGWNNIRHRIEFLKGKYEITSDKNKGTSVYIEWELPRSVL